MEQEPDCSCGVFPLSISTKPAINGFKRIHSNSDLSNSDSKFNCLLFKEKNISSKQKKADELRLCLFSQFTFVPCTKKFKNIFEALF